MPWYRRAHYPGGTFFFTVVTANRQPILTTDLARTLLHEAITQCGRRYPFRVDAFVLLPDHFHTIWTVPESDGDYSRRWAVIKKEFSQRWVAAGGSTQEISASKQNSRRVGVWQKRFWEHFVRADEFGSIVEYVHYNPVKHGYVRCPHEWPWSSFHRFVSEGNSRPDWRCVCDGNVQSPPEFPDSFDAFE